MKTSTAVLVVLVVLVAVLEARGEAVKCSKDVLDRLHEMWQKKGKPTNIMANTIAQSPEYEMVTTDNFFPNQARIRCVVTTLNKDATFSSTVTYTDNTNKTFSGSKVEEQDGVTYQPSKNVKRYHLVAGKNVDSFYRCEENGKEGLAEGLVKVWPGFKREDLDAAIADLEYVLGRKMRKQKFCPDLLK